VPAIRKIVILTRHVLVNYGAKSEKLWHYDNNGCHEIGSNCQHKVKRDMRYEKTHQNLRYDIKCIELNQNFYIICLTETMKEKMGLKKKQLYPEIVKLDDGHEIVVVHDDEGRNLLMQTSVPKKPLGYKLTPIDSKRHLAVTRNENGRLHAWIEPSHLI
jgi:hypothetical protein